MEQQLKQRLTGAIVLVSLAVIFIPVILEGPRDEWAPRDHTIPEPPDLGYHTPMDLPTPVTRDEKPRDPPVEEIAVEAVPGETPVPLPVPEIAEQEQAVPVKPQPPEEKSVAVSAREQTLANGWYVQVGSFSKLENASSLRDQLRSDGLDAHLQSVKADKGTSYRVLVGPSQTRSIAEKLQIKLVAGQKLGGIVIEISAPDG